MQRNKKILSLNFLAFTTLLLGCSPQTKVRVILPKYIVADYTNDIATFTKGVTEPLFNNLLTSKNSFLLYLYSEDCFYCQQLTPLLYHYFKGEQPLMYTLDYKSDTYINLVTKDDSLQTAGTPTIFLFNKGELFHQEVGTRNLKNEIDVVQFFKKYTQSATYTVYEEAQPINEKKYITLSFFSEEASHLTFSVDFVALATTDTNPSLHLFPFQETANVTVTFVNKNNKQTYEYPLTSFADISAALDTFLLTK